MTVREIYQAHLDHVSSCLWNGDGEGVAKSLKYPHVIHLPDADRIIKDPVEQKSDADAFRESLTNLGATAFHRLCRDARADPHRPERIIGLHTTYIMRGGHYLTEPYDCAMSLVQGANGTWLADAIRVSIRDSGMAYYHPDNIRNHPVQRPNYD